MKTTSKTFAVAAMLVACAASTADAQVSASLGDSYSPVPYEDGYSEASYPTSSCTSCAPAVDSSVYSSPVVSTPVVSSPVAQNCPASSGYFSIFGGGTSFDDLRTSTLNVQDSIFGNFDDGQASLELNEGWSIGAAVGRRMCRRLRTEFEFSYRSATTENGSLLGDGSGSGPVFPLEPVSFPGIGDITPPPIVFPGFGDLPTGTLPLDGRLNTYALMTNVLIDLNPGMSTVFYVGGGAGVNINSLNFNEPINQIDVSVNNSNFAYQGIAGVSKKLGRAEVFGEYRYFGTDKQSLNIDSPIGSLSTEGDGSGQNYFVGLRFNRR